MQHPFRLSALLVATALCATASMSAIAAMDDDAANSLLKRNDCLKCHSVDKTKKGPSFKKIAAKYKGKADGEEKLVKNFTTGPKVKLEDGTEEDHKIIDTKKPDELKALAQWVLSR